MGWQSPGDLAASWMRRMIYLRDETRLPASATEAQFRVSGATLRGWITNPTAEQALVYFGGNAEQVGNSRRIWESHFPGHASYLLAYRGYGASDGEPSEKTLVEDGVALVDEAAARHPGAPVAVIGRSLGSGVAAQVAARRQGIGRLVLVTPFDSLAAVIKQAAGGMPVRALVVDRFDSASVADRILAPTLVIRSGRDEVIPADRTAALVAALDPGRTTVRDFPTADHSSLSQDRDYWTTIARFLDDPARA